MNKAFRSVAIQVLLVILIWVLPLNFAAIHLANIAVDNVKTQAVNAVRNTTEQFIEEQERNLQECGQLMQNAHNQSDDARIVEGQKGDYAYRMAYYRYFLNCRSLLSLFETSDGAFCFLAKQGNVLLWYQTEPRKSEALKEYVRALYNSNLGPGIVSTSFEGKGNEASEVWYALRRGNMMYGNFVRLSSASKSLLSKLPYKAQITFSSDSLPETKGFTTVSVYWKNAGVYCNVILDNRELMGSTGRWYIVMYVLMVLFLILAPFFFWCVSKIVIKPLFILKDAHHELEENPDYRITAHTGTQEYRQVYDSFNNMADSIKHLKIANYENEIAKKQIEIKNLQLQIRPHFLLNMFNLILNLSRSNDGKHVQSVVMYLSNYFTYIFRTDKDRELFVKEEKLIEEYINVTNLRYPGGVTFTSDYDPELDTMRFPPLLLHSFVENVVKHVVRAGRSTEITVLGQYDDKTVTLMVIDNGPGIDETTLKEIRDNFKSKDISGTHVGIANAYRRLQAYYGEDTDINIESEMGIGTTVTIKFPYNLEAGE